MELAFTIPGAGPLSQIGVHILSFDTAVHLATGAIGWWKSRNRYISLTESISASKTSLVCTSAFNAATYKERRRQTGLVRGLAVQRSGLCAIPGSVQQTAISSDPGMDCLRALTTGLLCLYNVHNTTRVLADIIPFGMLQPDQEDETPAFEGPLLSSLRDWVTSVAAEEDCNTFRRHLSELVSSAQNGLISTRATQRFEFGYDSGDTNYLLGVLRWMVTPRHRREEKKYPTRSLDVWRTAVVMSELAFDISASLDPIHSSPQYNDFMSGANSGDHPDVALVTASVGDTDPWMLQQVHTESLTPRPQIVPIRSIPYVAFGHVRFNNTNLSPEELVDIWNVSFGHAKEAVGVPTLSRGGNVLLPARKDTALVRENHKHLVAIWSPHLARILRPAMDIYVPASFGDETWSHTEILAYFQRRKSGEPIMFEHYEIRDNVYKMTAILLGSIYGACFQSLIPMTSVDGNVLSEFLEVAFSSEKILGDKLFGWAASLGLALGGLLESSRWTGLLLELVTGIEHVQPLDKQPTAGLLGRRLNVVSQPGVFQESHVRVSDIFGAQVNGIFAVSDFVVRPSTNANNALKFHVGTGRILNLPVNDSGYLRASPISPASLDLPLNPAPELEVLSRQEGAASTPEAFRIDAEPHWEFNAEDICFGIRSKGISISTLNISQVLERTQNRTVLCKCGRPKSKVAVPRSERWQVVTVSQFLRRSYPGGSRCGAYIRDENKIIVDVEGDDVKRILVVGILQCRKMAICKDCVLCAYESIQNRDKTESVALIVG
jgi:hypothetical protein